MEFNPRLLGEECYLSVSCDFPRVGRQELPVPSVWQVHSIELYFGIPHAKVVISIPLFTLNFHSQDVSMDFLSRELVAKAQFLSVRFDRVMSISAVAILIIFSSGLGGVPPTIRRVALPIAVTYEDDLVLKLKPHDYCRLTIRADYTLNFSAHFTRNVEDATEGA